MRNLDRFSFHPILPTREAWREPGLPCERRPPSEQADGTAAGRAPAAELAQAGPRGGTLEMGMFPQPALPSRPDCPLPEEEF